MTLAIVFHGDGFLGGDWRDVLALASIVVTAVGFSIAAIAALRAASAANKATAAVARTLRLLDTSKALGTISEILLSLETAPGASNMRVSDLRAVVVQVRGNGSYDSSQLRAFSRHLTQLTFVRDELLAKIADGDYLMDIPQIHARLGELADFLNALQARIRSEPGDSDGHTN